MKRVIGAFLLGGAFVCIVEWLGHPRMNWPVVWLLLPGLISGAFAPDSGFGPEGDIHPWGPISTVIVYAVNIGLYSAMACCLLRLPPGKTVTPWRKHSSID